MEISASNYNTSSSEDCPTQFIADEDTIPTTTHPQLFCPNPLQRNATSRIGKQMIQSYLPQCPLCSSKRSNFYCAPCVISGDFVHSSTKLYERFSEKNLRLFALQRDINESKSAIELKNSRHWALQQLKEDIKVSRTKIKYLKHVIKQNNDRKAQGLSMLAQRSDSNTKRQLRIPQFEDKAVRMKQFVEKFIDDMDVIKNQLDRSQVELKLAQSAFIQSLHTSIFPVEEVLPSSSPSNPCPDQMMDFLADAIQTSYIGGRWVTADRSGEVQYRIVSPLLSGSGDYTPVYAWIASHKEGDRATGEVETNPAHTIAAGLSLACQFSTSVSNILGRPLPVKMKFSEFGVIETSEVRFARKVAKLNTNIVSLCLAVGVDISNIHPEQTLYNLCQLVKRLETEPGDGCEESELSASLLSAWETRVHQELEELRLAQISDSHSSEGSDCDSESVPGEWESVTGEHLGTEEAGGAGQVSQAHSSISFVSSTVSTLLWGITQSPKSPRK